ncbi:MAG: hypothetical protein GY861_22280 [bacterium]|nr:hypothetical protein [bacterium]
MKKEYFTTKEIRTLGLWDKHFQCGGGQVIVINTTQLFTTDIDVYQCTKCGDIYDASDYDRSAGYWATKYRKQDIIKLLKEVFK